MQGNHDLKNLHMKKMLLSVCLISIVCFYGYSQSLSLSNNNGPVTPNTILYQTGTPDSLELVTYLNVKNNSSQTMDVLCKKVELTLVNSNQVTMCWAVGCYSPTVYISSDPKSIAAGTTYSEFSGHYQAGEFSTHLALGESTVRWVFFDRANPNDSVSVIVKYAINPTGIDDATAPQVGMLSNICPNPASGDVTCNYAMPAGSQGTILVRDIVGTTVQTQLLPSASGKATISTLNLRSGIYFCSLLVDGKISQTKKLIVKH